MVPLCRLYVVQCGFEIVRVEGHGFVERCLFNEADREWVLVVIPVTGFNGSDYGIYYAQ